MSFKHVGKKVETSEVRLDKNVFFERAKSGVGFKRLVIDSQGRANNEIIGRRSVVLADDSDPFTVSNFTTGGIFKITPTSNLTKATPTATELIEGLLDVDGEALVAASYEAYEFSVINLSGARTLEISAGTGVTLVGNMVTAVSSSSRFQFVKTGGSAVELYRIA